MKGYKMIIVYYRDKETGKILRCHDSEGCTLQQLKENREKFSKRYKDIEAFIEEIDNNSIIAYLYNLIQEEKQERIDFFKKLRSQCNKLNEDIEDYFDSEGVEYEI